NRHEERGVADQLDISGGEERQRAPARQPSEPDDETPGEGEQDRDRRQFDRHLGPGDENRQVAEHEVPIERHAAAPLWAAAALSPCAPGDRSAAAAGPWRTTCGTRPKNLGSAKRRGVSRPTARRTGTTRKRP